MSRKSASTDLFVRERALAGVLESVRRCLRDRGAVVEERVENGRTYFIVGGQIEAVVGVWSARHRPGVVIEARRADKTTPWTCGA